MSKVISHFHAGFRHVTGLSYKFPEFASVMSGEHDLPGDLYDVFMGTLFPEHHPVMPF